MLLDTGQLKGPFFSEAFSALSRFHDVCFLTVLVPLSSDESAPLSGLSAAVAAGIVVVHVCVPSSCTVSYLECCQPPVWFWMNDLG